MPTDHWLHVWCIWHKKKVETLQEFRSRHLICWIIPDFWETRVSRSLTFRLKTKMPWYQTPLTNEESHHVYLLGSTKRCIFKSMWNKIKNCGIESLKYVREFYTLVCYCGDISTPQNVTLNETNCDWLFDMSVKRPHGLDQWMKNSCRTWYFCFLFAFFPQKRDIFFCEIILSGYTGEQNYLNPCCFCTFVHWQRNDQSIILMVGLF